MAFPHATRRFPPQIAQRFQEGLKSSAWLKPGAVVILMGLLSDAFDALFIFNSSSGAPVSHKLILNNCLG